MEDPRCQSCGMPLAEGFFGTEADGARSNEYCRFCYASGAYTDAQITLQGMIDASVSHMMRVLQYPESKAKELAFALIPRLKRWQNT